MAAIQANGERIMWVVLLEIALALGVAVLIVWWTWPRKRPDDSGDGGGKSSGDQ